MFDAFKPFVAFLVLDRTRNSGGPPCGTPLRGTPRPSCPLRSAANPQGECQQVVHHEALLIVADAATQALSRVQMRKVELRCVLNR
jgi:hypothetical protein